MNTDMKTMKEALAKRIFDLRKRHDLEKRAASAGEIEQLKKQVELLLKAKEEVERAALAKRHEFDAEDAESDLFGGSDLHAIVKRVAAPNTPQAELHELNDALIVASALRKCHPTQLKMYSKINKRIGNDLAKAMASATSGSGSNFVPTDFSATVYQRIESKAKLATLFREIPMTTPTFTLPVEGAAPTVYLQGEATEDSASKIPGSTPGTTSVNLVAKKLACRILTSTEWTEDSVIAAIPFIQDNIARAMARGYDDAILNGDTAATHQDSNVTAANDRRKAFLGLRAIAVDGDAVLTTMRQDIAGSTLAVADFTDSLRLMGVYGEARDEVAVVTSPLGFQLMIAALATAGANAVHESAVINQIDPVASVERYFNMKVAVTDLFATNLNASGVYDGTTTNETGIILVHKPSIVLGGMRGMTVKTAEDIETDQIIMVATMRKAMIDLWDETTVPFIHYITDPVAS